ncbi:MAG: DUF4360 domain-containing protein [Polyangiales bacterium]
MINVKTTAFRPGRLRSAVAAGAIGVLGMLGCEGAESEHVADSTALAQIEGVSQTVNVPDRNGTYFAEVKANGTGCPPGTWVTSISSDGQVFTTTFASYITQVSPNIGVNVRDCQIAIKLHTPEGRSFSVQSFSYGGYALLQPGVTGAQTANYYFQGNPLPTPESNRVALVGPYDSDYLFRDEVKIEDRVWSECGVERDLNITTRVMLQNSNPRRSGYMNLTAVDGSGKLELRIETQRCSLGQPTPTPTPTPADVSKVAQVRVSPTTVAPGESFGVRWQMLANQPDATYKVQVRSREDRLIWESPAFMGSGIQYNGPSLAAGTYRVLVVARVGTRETTSDPVTFVVASKTSPVEPIDPVQPPRSSLPAWARPLLGRYATRTDSFALMPSGTMLYGRQLGLAEFVEVEGGGLELRQRVCDESLGTRSSRTVLRTPDAFPEIRRRVTLDPGERWSTSATPLGTGFQRDGVAACAGRAGQYVAKRAEQRWISGSVCRCPLPNAAPTLDDCRVTDPDGDGQPGLAYVNSTALGDTVIHAASVVRSYLVNGYVDPNGAHVAPFRSDEVVFPLSCDGRGSCGEGEPGAPCKPEFNRTEFARLPSSSSGGSTWTCGAVRNNEARLFPSSRLPTPSRCTRDTLTELP